MVFVTHDQEEALSIGDKIGIMNGGRLEQLGTPRQIYENPRSPFILDFIGDSNIIEDAGGGFSFVRPEMIDISDCNKNVKGKAMGKIEDKVFLGPYINYKINEDGKLLKVQVTNKSIKEYEIGDEVYLDYKTSKLRK